MATKPSLPSQQTAVGRDDTFPLPEPQAARLLSVLRFLGRVYVSDMETIHRLLYAPHASLRTAYQDMRVLTGQRHVWDATVSGFRGGDTHKRTEGRQRQLYGLSRAGKELLQQTGIEADKVLDQLVARDTRGKAPNGLRLAHDLRVAMWCASRLEELRAFPWCTGFHCQTQLRLETGATSDARIIARFHPAQPRASLVALPWLDDRALVLGEVEMQWVVRQQGLGQMHLQALASDTGEELAPTPLNLGNLGDDSRYADKEAHPLASEVVRSGSPRLPRFGRPIPVVRAEPGPQTDQGSGSSPDTER